MASEALESLVDRIYEAGLVPDLWPGVLAELAKIANGFGTLLVARRGAGCGRVGSPSMNEVMKEYIAGGWHKRSPRGPRVFAARHAGFLNDFDIFMPEEMDREPIFTEFLRPRGFGWASAPRVERLGLAAAILALAVTLPLKALAQERARVAEDTLVVNDPEVAAPGKWKVGGALEYWYVRVTTNVPQGSGTTLVTSNQFGGNAFAGYDNVTFQYTQRSGQGHLDTSANVAGGLFTTIQELKQLNKEVTLRWLARDFSTGFVTPYLIAGYAWTDARADITLTSGQIGGGCISATSYTRESNYTAPLLGIGGIFAVTETIGVRLDARYKHYHINTRALGVCPEVSANGDGGDLTATGYYLMTPEWSFQLGAKYQTIPGGAIQNAPGFVVMGNRSIRIGAFGMLGYSYEF
jgi:hypothetical protein